LWFGSATAIEGFAGHNGTKGVSVAKTEYKQPEAGST